ncbi:MAG: hypothetical protein H8M99_01330 [Gloeobacteraceae cyanobacterium ES-bin-144]|nr:hypothetical protein [Verrucomicrobiales bacterium]
MRPSTIPTFCGVALIAMSAAGISHWWSVHEFSLAMNAGNPAIPQISPLPQLSVPPKSESARSPDLLTKKTPKPPTTAPVSSQEKEFYQALMSRVEKLNNQQRDVLDQIGETNRSLMQLEFRVDTHSESFRPMPVTDDRPDTGFENEPSVLPPRAEPVDLPSHE